MHKHSAELSKLALLLFLLAPPVASRAAASDIPPVQAAAPARAAWLPIAPTALETLRGPLVTNPGQGRFGLFIHWGIYSALGGAWNGRKIEKGYSEQIEMWGNIPERDYLASAAKLTSTEFDPRGICMLAHDAGMSYLVFTSKHHDGFMMFDSGQDDFDFRKSGIKHDPLRALAESCRPLGLGVGVYFSIVDWHMNRHFDHDNNNAVDADMENLIGKQVSTLATRYGPLSEFWFDMGSLTPEQSRSISQIVRRSQPGAAINSRIWNDEGDFTSLPDNVLPGDTVLPPFEVPKSIEKSTWGYREWQTHPPLAEKIGDIEMSLARTIAMGGHYLLNIGLEGDGSVQPYERSVIVGVGQWIRANHDAVLEDDPMGLPPQAWGSIMDAGTHVDLYVNPGQRDISLDALSSQPQSVRILATGKDIAWSKDGPRLTIHADTRNSAEVTVIRLEFAGRPERATDRAIALDGTGPVTIPYGALEKSYRLSSGAHYGLEHLVVALAGAYIAAPTDRTIVIRLNDIAATRDTTLVVAVGGNRRIVTGAALGRPIGPFSLPANKAVPLAVWRQGKDHLFDGLGCDFSSLGVTWKP